MGEVYQATDSKLGRSVAIKLLPEAFTHDADRSARFEREARVLASLNHPNIAAIYGVEESANRRFLVMELVSGETLAERIKRGAIPVEEALGIAAQITEALEAAHEQGVVHRDLKPANVKVTRGGEGEGPRFRACESVPRADCKRERLELADSQPGRDDAGHHPGNGGVHESGAGEGTSGGPPDGHLRLWCRTLRDADGCARIRWRGSRRDSGARH